ncbi:hypothetical protein HanHA300_Chr15g0585951 [Helianthus annuus]|nr:hypothetical protein HanHA300_Chr15g0585951 [Helianthus annuus]KAJ0474961.1 hypothetical protein HanHA89_Chr15g0635741 [Helianthus annuus]KAJ0650516.1 hypothetical protein HanLR1_Chr15g0596651 [Helianthus annuus]KAJ0654269.1 hypothetical protein HanOQP8_Chr15g0593071 [Helianthus annuus]
MSLFNSDRVKFCKERCPGKAECLDNFKGDWEFTCASKMVMKQRACKSGKRINGGYRL